jgi:hypothetical protein
MKISDFLSPAHVMIDVRSSDKNRLLEQLSTQVAAEVGLDSDEVVREPNARSLDRPVSATTWHFPTRGSEALRRPSACSPGFATASTSTPSTASL